MRNENDCPIEQRYLFSNEVLFEEGIESCRQETIRRYKTGNYKIFDDYKASLDTYINWKRQPNEVVLFTLYAYADLPIPATFNCLFNTDNPTEYTIAKLTINQSIYEGFYPINTIEDGHKHLLICRFENDIIPDIINKLCIGKAKHSDTQRNSFKMGICNFSNFSHITKRLNRVKELKEKYGCEWWSYDE